jgi:DNA excision repair protein ERCC-6
VGQTREVTVYRLITAGTIEEKVYHRQIYKQHMSDAILKNPKQRRIFKAKELADLFSFDEAAAAGGADSETANLFAHLHTHLSPPEPDGAAAAEEPCDDGDILTALLASNGVARAMDHDAIAANAKAPAGDARCDGEAQRIARAAVLAVDASRMSSREGAAVWVPTWTGRSGAAGAPGGAARHPSGMVSSADMLAGARLRAAATAAAGRERPGAVGGARGPESGGVVRQIAAFLRSRGGRASSEAVLREFESCVPAGEAAAFKAALRAAATLQSEGARKVWVLNAQYRRAPAAD